MDVTEEDKGTVPFIVFRAITSVLTRPTFVRMQSAREFERWLDAQVAAAALA